MKMFKIFFLALTITLFSSCEEFLDVPPKGTLVFVNVDDYESLLNHRLNLSVGVSTVALFGDGFMQTPALLFFNTRSRNAAIWADFIFEQDRNDVIWEESYNNILNWNAIIEQILDAKGDSKKAIEVRAEAFLARATVYLYLVNVYAKPYNAATASTDMAIPIKTFTGPESNFQRASVQQVYDFIISDLEQALEQLPMTPPFNSIYRGSVAGAYGMLARTYMLMGKYDLMLENVNNTFDLSSPMEFDFNNLVGLETSEIFEFFEDEIRFPDEVYRRESQRAGTIFNEVYVTQEYNDLFDDNDLRKSLFIKSILLEGMTNQRDAETGFLFASNVYRISSGVMKEDLHLMRAEAEIRVNNNMAKAIEDLNTLRKLRFVEGAYVPLTVNDFATSANLLQFVIDERRREFGHTEYRWFDLRRLAGSLPTAKTQITREIGNMEYTLNLLNDKNHVMAIPREVISFNPGMEQNPRDGKTPFN